MRFVTLSGFTFIRNDQNRIFISQWCIEIENRDLKDLKRTKIAKYLLGLKKFKPKLLKISKLIYRTILEKKIYTL